MMSLLYFVLIRPDLEMKELLLNQKAIFGKIISSNLETVGTILSTQSETHANPDTL